MYVNFLLKTNKRSKRYLNESLYNIYASEIRKKGNQQNGIIYTINTFQYKTVCIQSVNNRKSKF